MRRLLLTFLLLAVGLGLTLGPFHVHPDGGHCNVCKDIRVATPAAGMVVAEGTLRPAEPPPAPTRQHLPEGRSYTRPPLRAPPVA